ncbi:MAG: hypothetical protein ACI4TE_07330 [Alphaproteobacteria bacterium]
MAEIEKTEQEKTSAEQGNFTATPQKTGENTAEQGNFTATPEKAGEYTAEQQQEQQQGKVGSFHAKAHEKKDKEKGPDYKWLETNNEDDAAKWLIEFLKNDLRNWMLGNLEFVGYYIDKGLNKGVEFINKKKEKQKLGDDKDKKKTKNKDGKDKDKADKDKPGKDKDNKDKSGKDKEKPAKTSQQERNDLKAQKAQDLADKAKKNMANRNYDNSALGKNQQAYDQMTVESLQREADYRKNVATIPGYAKSPEGRKARAELVGDRKALAAMQKETGVNNKIVDGDIKKKTKGQKAVQKARIGLKAAGLAARDQKKKITNKVKQAHQKGVKKLKQKANLKMFSNLKAQMKNIARKKSRPQSRQQGNSMVPARKKQNAGR